jgi:hypothetical protein
VGELFISERGIDRTMQDQRELSVQLQNTKIIFEEKRDRVATSTATLLVKMESGKLCCQI